MRLPELFEVLRICPQLESKAHREVNDQQLHKCYKRTEDSPESLHSIKIVLDTLSSVQVAAAAEAVAFAGAYVFHAQHPQRGVP